MTCKTKQRENGLTPMKLKIAGLIILFMAAWCTAQPFQFAFIADTHIGGATGQSDLELTAADINALPEIDFVILAGDVTEFGSDEELALAKKILDRLEKPWHVIPGNHDSKWSESGCNSFARIFREECFSFTKNGFRFIGTASGPNMRMAPGLIPREHLLFLESALKTAGNLPIIFINHYPLNDELANYGNVIDLLKTRNIQASLLGHGHANNRWDFEGIPGVMGRSNLRSEKGPGGYTIVTVDSLQLTFAERTPGGPTLDPWCTIPVGNHHFDQDTTRWGRPDYSLNKRYQNAGTVWKFTGSSDIGTGIAAMGEQALYANTKGEIVALDARNGRINWKFPTNGKIYATPAISGGNVICASTDSIIYCLDLKNGSLKWRFKTGKSIVASPLVRDNRVYIGSSEGLFRCLNLISGCLIWQYAGVNNFVETRPLFYQKTIYFGSWGNTFYALDAATGKLVWKREKYANRMLSPAAVQPVAAHGKIFIVAPDRRMTALDAATGAEIWDSGNYSCRESIGISEDSALVYVKTMKEGNFCAFRSDTTAQYLAWQTITGAGYEIAPTPIVEHEGVIFMPTTAGIVYAVDKRTHRIAWVHKLSNALVTGICPAGKAGVLVTTLDGTVACITYQR
jgi:outer membrane protein assembly factor BamB/predicted phosphodiesterase